jgi:hypothetical protein
MHLSSEKKDHLGHPSFTLLSQLAPMFQTFFCQHFILENLENKSFLSAFWHWCGCPLGLVINVKKLLSGRREP